MLGKYLTSTLTYISRLVRTCMYVYVHNCVGLTCAEVTKEHQMSSIFLCTKSFLKILFVHMCVLPECLYSACMQRPWRPEEGIRWLWAAMGMGAGDQTRVLWRAASDLKNCWAIALALHLLRQSSLIEPEACSFRIHLALSPNTEFIAHVSHSQLLCGSWRLELKSSCLHSKCSYL